MRSKHIVPIEINLFGKMALSIVRKIKNNMAIIANKMRSQAYRFKWKFIHIPNNKKICVGFLVQDIHVWDKERPLYERLCSLDRFNVALLVIPRYDWEKKSFVGYDNLSYFKQFERGNNIVCTTDADGKVLNLRKFDFDFLFYPRPYDIYLPNDLRTKETIRYTRTCYIPYAYQGIRAVRDDYNNDFFDNLLIYFCSSYSSHIYYKKIHHGGSIYCGYPIFDFIKIEESNIKTKETVNILWTPRWTNDSRFGGTSFSKYKEHFLELKGVSNKTIRLTLRPHPMMFSDMVSMGSMSDEDVKTYMKRLSNADIILDSNVSITDTLNTTDILITDYSSIVIQFFLTGKPIVYCGDTDVDFSDEYMEMISSLYIATSWVDIQRSIHEVIEENDRLREKRISLGKKIVKHENAVEEIIKKIEAF